MRHDRAGSAAHESTPFRSSRTKNEDEERGRFEGPHCGALVLVLVLRPSMEANSTPTQAPGGTALGLCSQFRPIRRSAPNAPARRLPRPRPFSQEPGGFSPSFFCELFNDIITHHPNHHTRRNPQEDRLPKRRCNPFRQMAMAEVERTDADDWQHHCLSQSARDDHFHRRIKE